MNDWQIIILASYGLLCIYAIIGIIVNKKQNKQNKMKRRFSK